MDGHSVSGLQLVQLVGGVGVLFVIHLDRHAARVHVHRRDDAQIAVVRTDTCLGPGTLKRDVVVILDLHDFITQT